MSDLARFWPRAYLRLRAALTGGWLRYAPAGAAASLRATRVVVGAAAEGGTSGTLVTEILGAPQRETVKKTLVKSILHPGHAIPGRGLQTEGFSQIGAPAKTQRLGSRWRLCRFTDAAYSLRVSGFRGERTSSGMSELSAQAGSEGYGDLEDEDRTQRFLFGP